MSVTSKTFALESTKTFESKAKISLFSDLPQCSKIVLIRHCLRARTYNTCEVVSHTLLGAKITHVVHISAGTRTDV